MGVPPLFFVSRLPEYAADPARMDAGGLRRPWRRGKIKKLVGLLQRVFFSAPNASFLELIYEGFGYDLGDETSYTTALNMRND